MLSRRQFLGGVAALSLGGCAAAPAEPIPILDTHTHFYDPTRPGGVQWPPANDPLLHRPVLPPEFEALARPCGITGTIVVEASPDESDNEWVLEKVAHHPFLRGLVGHLKPGSSSFKTRLDRLRSTPTFLGIRTGGWDGPLDPDRPGFLRDCAQLASAQRVLEVLVGPDRLPAVARIGREHPGLRIVIDHCANLRIDGKAPPGEWLRGMDACAALPNITCKVSGLVEGSGRTDGDAPSDPAFYAPVLDALWDRFGQRRLIFGSNWPVSARFAPLSRIVQIARDAFLARGIDAARDVLGQNAHRIYRVPTA